jgi:drug/metabolite transporter (DMT)-like permease
MSGFLFILSLIFFTDLIDTVGQLILKASINRMDFHINTVARAFKLVAQLLKIPRVWMGFSLSGLSLVVWLFVLTRTELGFAFSLDSMRYILIALASAIFLKEKITPGRWLGIFSVVLGIILVASGHR